MAFHSVVCIKAVMVAAPITNQGRSAASMVMNPYDGAALETALRLRDDRGGTVTALSMGPPASKFVLHEALAMGVDRAVLLSDPALAGSDTLATSSALTAGIKRLMPYDLVLFGTRTSDSDTGQVGPQVAVALDVPLVTWARDIAWSGERMVVDRRADGFFERFEVSLPAALTMDPGAVTPRDLPLAGIHCAFEEKMVEIWTVADVGLGVDQVGSAGSPTVVVSMKRITRDRKCTFITGTVEEQVDKLVSLLQDKGLIGI
jgi:electron transfer flavoprotein beta subunit